MLSTYWVFSSTLLSFSFPGSLKRGWEMLYGTSDFRKKGPHIFFQHFFLTITNIMVLFVMIKKCLHALIHKQ